MGNANGKDKNAGDKELFHHQLYLDEYLIGKHPVTVAQFQVFVKDSGYKTTAELTGGGWVYMGKAWRYVRGANYQHPHGPESDLYQKANHPVTQVSWEDAQAFCIWLSRLTGHAVRLPSEAEWEKAARGTDGRIYPWGNDAPDHALLNYNMHIKDTAAVGSYPRGASQYGLLDMAGNVWEWVNDWFDKNYTQNPPQRNPKGPDFGQQRGYRGGSWSNGAGYIQPSNRSGGNPDGRFNILGFRCAR